MNLKEENVGDVGDVDEAFETKAEHSFGWLPMGVITSLVQRICMLYLAIDLALSSRLLRPLLLFLSKICRLFEVIVLILKTGDNGGC